MCGICYVHTQIFLRVWEWQLLIKPAIKFTLTIINNQPNHFISPSSWIRFELERSVRAVGGGMFTVSTQKETYPSIPWCGSMVNVVKVVFILISIYSKLKLNQQEIHIVPCGICPHVDDGGGAGGVGIFFSISFMCEALNWRCYYIRHTLMLMAIPTGPSIALLIEAMPLHYRTATDIPHIQYRPSSSVVSRVHIALRAEPEHSRLIYLNHNDIILFWKYN